MNIQKSTVEKLQTRELLSIFNQFRKLNGEKTIKKFTDRSTAERRTLAIFNDIKLAMKAVKLSEISLQNKKEINRAYLESKQGKNILQMFKDKKSEFSPITVGSANFANGTRFTIQQISSDGRCHILSNRGTVHFSRSITKAWDNVRYQAGILVKTQRSKASNAALSLQEMSIS